MGRYRITLYELFTGQILPGAHHVFQVMSARLLRGNAVSRLTTMGVKIEFGDAALADLILDMHLRGAEGRPSIERIRGCLEREYSDRVGAQFPPARR